MGRHIRRFPRAGQLGGALAVFQTLSAPRFSGILIKDADITFFSSRLPPCDNIAPR